VASLSGFLNMIRAFVFAAGVLLYLITGRLRELLLPVVLLALCVGEVSRGGILVLLLHGAAIYVLSRRVSVGRIFKIGGFALLFIVAFGILGQFRGASVDPTDFVSSGSAFTSLPLGFFFAFTYLVSPLNNLYYGADMLTPLLYPYYSVQPLLPTVIREIVFGPDAVLDRYPIALYIDSFNATSFYGPLLADFGFAGAGIIVTIIQVITAWCHVMARRGSLIHFLIYPALFMSVLLSVFYMYFFALIVVLYPLLAYGYRHFRRRVLRRAWLRALRSQHSRLQPGTT
jgi:oligosaccharide repeat unit polymerase